MNESTDERQTSAMSHLAGSGRHYESAKNPGLVETANFGANPGALRMLSYAPAGLRPGSPLVVVLHGCTQHAADNALGAGWLRLADRLGFAVLAPEQSATNNLNRCFNWFLAGDTRRETGECASIANMIAAQLQLQDLDAQRVFISGLSAGGAMAAVMLATYPELFAGGAIIAGLPYGAAHSLQEAMRAMRGALVQDEAALIAAVVDAAARPPNRPFRLSIWHGDKDVVVAPSNARALLRQWTAAKGPLDLIHEDQAAARHTRTTCSDGTYDGAIIELNMIQGLGHGTPMSTTAPGDVGAPGPFLLECGVSSTLDIANFWGLDASAAHAAAAESETTIPAPRVDKIPGPPTENASPSHGDQLAVQVLGSLERHVPKEIHDVIARSLRAAGLLK